MVGSQPPSAAQCYALITANRYVGISNVNCKQHKKIIPQARLSNFPVVVANLSEAAGKGKERTKIMGIDASTDGHMIG
jgi:hypothetical protein